MALFGILSNIASCGNSAIVMPSDSLTAFIPFVPSVPEPDNTIAMTFEFLRVQSSLNKKSAFGIGI